jgi:hypothetical protein
MYTFENSICWPDPIKREYLIDWTGVGDENVFFKIYVSREREGPFREVVSLPFPPVTIAFSDVLFAIDGGGPGETDQQSISGGTEPDPIFYSTLNSGETGGLIEKQNLNFIDDLWFIVSSNSSSSGGAELSRTEPFRWAYIPERSHYLKYREIMRRTELDIDRYIGGRKSYLFRLKTYGEIAKNVNPILKMPIGIEEKESFGQKYHGGYLPPIQIKCGYTNEQGEMNQITHEIGKTDVRQIGLVSMPYPIVRPDDIIVNADTNERYIVLKGVKTPTFRGLPLRQLMTLSKLPRTDSAYNLQIPA